MKFRIAGGVLLAALILAQAPPASAQCAMCANAAAAQQAEARKALNMGIATLAGPVMLLFGGFVFLSYKRRNSPDDSSGGPAIFDEPAAPNVPVTELPLESQPKRPRPTA